MVEWLKIVRGLFIRRWSLNQTMLDDKALAILHVEIQDRESEVKIRPIVREIFEHGHWKQSYEASKKSFRDPHLLQQGLAGLICRGVFLIKDMAVKDCCRFVRC